LGDSITQDGRYVALVEAAIMVANPEIDIQIIGAGLASETVSGITEPVHPYPRPNINDRSKNIIDLVNPDWIVACYGMNDGIYHPSSPNIVAAYTNGLSRLVETAANANAKLILVTPPPFDVDANPIVQAIKQADKTEPYGYKNPYPKYCETLQELSAAVASFQDHPSVHQVIDLQAPMTTYLSSMKSLDKDYQYGDGVHPPLDGHVAMANLILRSLDLGGKSPSDTLFGLTGIDPTGSVAATTTDAQTQWLSSVFDRFHTIANAYRSAAEAIDHQVASTTIGKAIDSVRSERVRLTHAGRVLLHGNVIEASVDSSTKTYGAEIAALNSLDQPTSETGQEILFIGSSSIRLWDSIETDMAPYATIRRGFGGANYADLAVFADRLIAPHQFQAVVVFIANDIKGNQNDATPEQVQSRAQYVCDVALSHCPDAKVFLVEVTPTPDRFVHWRDICDVNAGLRKISLTTPNVFFVPTADAYLDDRKQPQSMFFGDDQLHLNAQGYKLWSSLIKASLQTHLQPNSIDKE